MGSSESSPYQHVTPNDVDMSSSSHYSGDQAVAGDVIQMGIVKYQEAEELLVLYASEHKALPWLKLPSELSLETFRQQKPFLLLSLLAVASRKQARLYKPILSEFKKVLSAKTILDGTPDLDLLQGLLVYLSW